MGIVFVLLAVVLFAVADYLIRLYLRKSKENKIRQEREDTLNKNLDVDFSYESASLKRVEVENPVARILAVDDEEIILDSFRKILVLDGYSVDTVQTGQEALGLVQKNQYDFVFTDLKMPEMSGVDVCKGVKHLRPDIDVIIITGYASVDTAVETMKYGAMDYIQKPFTEDELLELVKKFVIRRGDKLESKLKSNINIVHQEEEINSDARDFSIPGGIFIGANHTWLSLSDDGMVALGIDDFAHKTIGQIDEIVLPKPGAKVQKREVLFSIKQGDQTISFQSAISGSVSSVNMLLGDKIKAGNYKPYFDNWICKIEADDLDNDLKNQKIGNSAVEFFSKDINRFSEIVEKSLKASEEQTVLQDISSFKKTEYDKIVELFFTIN